MNHAFTLPIVAMRALCKLAAKEDIRYYLNGVNVEITGTDVRLVATDGHALGVYRHTLETNKAAAVPVSFIIPRKALDGFKPLRKMPLAAVSFDTETKIGFIKQGENQAVFTAIDARFPDWRSAIPRECSGDLAQFNPSILVRFQQVAKALAVAEDLSLAYNGTGGALVELYKVPEFIGVAMPWRKATPTLPDWVFPVIANEKAA